MNSGESIRTMIGTLVFLLAGPIVWAINLTLIYGAQSSLCAFEVGAAEGGTNGAVTAAIVVATLGTLGALGIFNLNARASYDFLCGQMPPEDQWPFLAFAMRMLA